MPGRHMRPMPPDFPEHARDPFQSLMKRYHAANTVIIRWKELCGTLRDYNHKHPIRIDPKTKEQKRYESVKEAAKELYGSKSTIYHAIRSGKKAYGYLWTAETEE